MRTQSQPFHDDTLASKTSVTVKLETHDLVAREAFCRFLRQRLHHRKLLCTSFTEGDRIDSLKMGRIREHGDFDGLSSTFIVQSRSRD